MTRLVASLAAAAVLLTGCSGSGARSVLDPFSRTRVEPPRTGCIMGQPADPYYSGTRQAALPNPPATRSGAWTPASATTPASTTTPKAGSRYDPPGRAYDYRGASMQKEVSLPATGPGDRIAIPLAARNVAGSSSNGAGATAASEWAVDRVEVPTSPVAATSSAVATTDALGPRPDRASRQPAAKAPSEVLASRERIVGTVQPRPTPSVGSAQLGSDAGAVTSARNEPGRLAVPQQTIDIMDLPPPGATHGVRSASRSGRGAIRLVSATAEVGGVSAKPPQSGTPRSTNSGDKPRDSFSPRANYGHDPEYRWLRGRLEYSEIDRRWKLRYIPIDGATDEFGGSVVLSDASRLSGYERGRFVEVHGGLGRPPEDEDRGYAPEFQIHEIKRLGS